MTDADLRDRIATIASEAFGPFPVQTVEEDLTAIERGIHEAGKAREEWRARAEKLQQADEMDHRVVLVEKLKTNNAEFRALAEELLESSRLANVTNDGHRDAHAAYQRWASKHAPDATSDEAKREAIETRLTAAEGRLGAIDKCRATLRLVDEQRMLLNDETGRPPLDPSDLPVLTREVLEGPAPTTQPWDEADWNALMTRKAILVDRKLDGTATADELAELRGLQRVTSERRDREFPLPIAELERIQEAIDQCDAARQIEKCAGCGKELTADDKRRARVLAADGSDED